MLRVRRAIFVILAIVSVLVVGLSPRAVFALLQGDVNTWQTLGESLPDTLAGSSSAVYNGYVYTAGGNNGTDGYTNKVYYTQLNSDGTTGEWQTSATNLPANRVEPAVVAYNGYLYVMGGFDGGTAQNTVYYAALANDGSVGTWATSSNTLPYGANAATAVVNNGYIYYMGGVNFSSIYGNVVYAQLSNDGSVGTWTTSGNSMAQRLRAASFVANNRLYVIGGYDGVSNKNTVMYTTLNNDGSVSSWNDANNLPAALHSLAVSYNAGYVYVLGGNDSGPTSSVYYAKVKANGTLDSWHTASNALPETRQSAVAASYGDYVYLIGGDNGSDKTSAVFSARVEPYNANADDDNDGITNGVEDSAPNNGDANDDSFLDSQQSSVASFVNPVTGKYVALVLGADGPVCDITSVSIAPELINSVQDSGYDYSLGMLNFTAQCPSEGLGQGVGMLYFNEAINENYVLRKYNSTTHEYTNVGDENYPYISDYVDSGDNHVLAVSYLVVEGGSLDSDGLTNSVIVDPAGLALVATGGAQSQQGGASGGSQAESGNSGLAGTGQSLAPYLSVASFLVLASFGINILRRRTASSS